ncbi:MAG TPA: hypothetical protein VJT71_00920 [Pyrinomonadaceae bacterium]|nr:hypothetical protein [Pyrinomonadaceae bacterium]
MIQQHQGSKARAAEEKPLAIDSASGFPVVLFGLTFGLRTFGKKASQRIAQEDNQTTDYQFLRLGLSHLTVIYTHMLLDHLLSSVEGDNKKEERSRQSVFFSMGLM